MSAVPLSAEGQGGSCISLTAAELAAAIHADQAEAERLLPVVAAMVGRYAPNAPQAIRNEAAIRAAGWLKDQPKASKRDQSAGPLSASYAPSMHSALRHSGAMALLTMWKARRGGAI